ncbi:hypothetical protein AN958_10626, partial [Leucoagaricus sp. SymC.cos]
IKPMVEVPAVPFRQISQDKENRKEKRPPNYRHETPIEQDVDIHKVLNKLLKSTTGVLVKELMALSPKLRDTYKEYITKKWVATQLHDLQESDNKSEKDELTKIVQVNLSTLKDCELSRENPSLLGQPFDTLTQSQVQNTTDGGQTLILTDPNTGK